MSELSVTNEGTGIRYPSKDETNEIIEIFGNWLGDYVIDNRSLFGRLIDLIDSNPVFYGLSYAMNAVDRLTIEHARAAESSVDFSEELTSMIRQKDKLQNEYDEMIDAIEGLTEEVERYTPEFFSAKREKVKERIANIIAAHTEEFEDLGYRMRKYRNKYGPSSEQYYQAKEAYEKAKSIVEGPAIEYNLRYGDIEESINQKRELLKYIKIEAQAHKKKLNKLNQAIETVETSTRKSIRVSNLTEFNQAWAEAFTILARCMRWNDRIIDQFRDPDNNNRNTFVADIQEALKQAYQNGMLRTQSELDQDVADKVQLRKDAADKARTMHIDPRTRDPMDIHKEFQVDKLLVSAEKCVDSFARVNLYELKTEIDFRPKAANYKTYVSTRRLMPRIGYFEFRIAATAAFRAYQNFLTKFESIDAGTRSEMIDALVELSQTFTEYGKHIKSVNNVTKSVMFGDQIMNSHESISVDIMQAAIGIAVDQLSKEEPDIDNYAKAFIDDQVPGYIGGQIDDIRCEFYNPFDIAPVYFIFGVAGARHASIDKTYYWLHIMNTECEDMGCIPAALAIHQPGIVSVPDDQVEAVKTKITTMSAAELADSNMAYQAILQPIIAPWIIVKGITQMGDWQVYKYSDISLFNLTPIQFKARMNEVVGLHLKQGHVSRITGFDDYDGAGWEYELNGFTVVAKINSNTGVGTPLLKMLRGNGALFDYGGCCIGEQTYSKMVSYKQDHQAANMLDYLISRDLIPELVHDALQRAEDDNMLLGPGELDGEYFESVPITKLNEADCITQTTTEYDQNSIPLATRSYKMWNMLRLPRWLVVSNINKDDETWTVESYSDPSLKDFKPADAVKMMSNLIVFARKTSTSPARVSDLHRVIDYFIKLTNEDGSTTQYSGRYNLVVMCNSTGIINTIRDNVPISDDGDALILPEEFMNANNEDNIEDQLACFKSIRYVLINEIVITGNGRIKSFETKVKQGKVSANDVAQGAKDLLRLWLDPNGQVWLIIDSRWYNVQKCLKDLYDDLPIAYIGADYETLNKGEATYPVLLSWARQDGDSTDITSGCFKGIQCTRQFSSLIADIAVKEHRRVIVITFHGSFFDMHMMLEGIATWGNFGQYYNDRIIAVGNKILEIDWLKMVKFIDLRRFTMNSLAGICEAFHVKNPKSDINLKLVQGLYNDCNCNLDSFNLALRKMPSSALIAGIEEDRMIPEFQEKISKMNGEQAYAEYCINDSIATVQCYAKVKEACLKAGSIDGIPEDLREEFKKTYDIDLYCTIPAMAYKCYRSGLPIKDGQKVKPPIASNLHIHQHLKSCGVGGRSEVYDFVPPHIITEEHQIFDIASLFPFGAMTGHMPYGDLHAVSQLDEPISQDILDSYPGKPEAIELRQLPVANKLGFYYCTIETQPELIVIPKKEKGQSLDWKCRQPFSRWVHIIMVRLHIFLGGTIKLHHGYYWDNMNDHYFDNSLRFWKQVKMSQDVLKGMLPTVSDEDPSVDMPKLESILASHDPKVSWAFKDGIRDEEKIAQVLRDYNPMVRWLVKMMSNSLLGRMAKKLKEYEIFIMSGSAPVEKFIEDHQHDKFVIHPLSQNVAKNPSAMTQLTVPYSKCSMISLDIEQENLFAKAEKTLKIPEACVSVTMFAYTHFHVAMALNRFYKAHSIRGIETDGIHANPKQYTEWCESQGIANPFWIDGPLTNVQPGSILDDAIFKPTPGDDRSAQEMPRLGAFYCPSAANRYASEHNLAQVSKIVDYGCYTEELRNRNQYDVFYPFCKFYYYKCLDTGAETFKAKGISCSKKSPSRNAHDYIILEHSEEYAIAGINNEAAKQAKMIRECLDRSEPVLSRKLFEDIGKGIGVDALDYRFQGRLSKLNASIIHTDDLVPGTNTKETPIHYTMCLKRIEPHKAYRVYESNGSYYKNGFLITADELKAIEATITEIITRDQYIEKRGSTLELASGPTYLSNSIIRKIWNIIKSRN
jgi:hypothetical protein